MGFCERAVLGAPVGRTRADAQRARSTTTHGRPLAARWRGWNVRRARAERPEGTFYICIRGKTGYCNTLTLKGLFDAPSRRDFGRHADHGGRNSPRKIFRVILPSQYPATASVAGYSFVLRHPVGSFRSRHLNLASFSTLHASDPGVRPPSRARGLAYLLYATALPAPCC